MDYLSLSLLVSVTFVVAGMVKGVTGMGLPTVAMAILGSLVAPKAAATLLLFPSLVTNLWQIRGPKLRPLLRRLGIMLAAIALATWLSAGFLAGGDAHRATLALGLALMLYALLALILPPLRLRPALEPWLGAIVGGLTGVVTGTTGVFVIPTVPYLQALDLERDELVQALGLSFTVSTLALGLGLWSHGAVAMDYLLASLAALLPALLGQFLGQWLRHRVGGAAFRRWFLIVLCLPGGEMVLRGVL